MRATAGRSCARLAGIALCFAYLSFSSGQDPASRSGEVIWLALDLQLPRAREILEDPYWQMTGEPYGAFLLHYCDVIELVATGDASLYPALIDSFEARLETVRKKEPVPPDALAMQSEMLFLAGLVQIRYGTPLNGASKILSAYRLNRQGMKDHPGRPAYLKMSAVFNILFDNIPPWLRWTAGIFGFEGDQELGLQQLQDYAGRVQDQRGLNAESTLLVMLACRMAGQENQALACNDRGSGEGDAVLVRFVRASLASYRFRNDQALPELAAIRGEALPVCFFGLDYLEGRCLLNRLDPAAGIPLLAFLEKYPGSDYRKDVANRLSYHYLLTGDTARFLEYRGLVLTTGQELRDRDREAALESRRGGIPHAGLLRARLLFDGGYFHRADSVLSSIDPASLKKTEEKLEYHYRRGRMLQETGRQDEAIQELMYAVNYGMGEPVTWPCRAALNLGQIYEERGDRGRAGKWYGSSISLFDESHTVESVKQRAEKGKERCRRDQE